MESRTRLVQNATLISCQPNRGVVLLDKIRYLFHNLCLSRECLAMATHATHHQSFIHFFPPPLIVAIRA